MIFQDLIQQLGVTDEVTECGCCGKKGLKKTVVFKVSEESDMDDEFVFLGSECSQKAKAVKVAKGKVRQDSVSFIEFSITDRKYRAYKIGIGIQKIEILNPYTGKYQDCYFNHLKAHYLQNKDSRINKAAVDVLDELNMLEF